MKRLLALLMLISAPAAAEPADPDLARLQAAEAAVRAGRNTQPSVIVNHAASPDADSGKKHVLAMPNGAPREFPVPARAEQQASGNGVQALVAAGVARPTPAPKPANGDKEATAAGLDAIAGFRHDHGVAH